MCTRIKQGRKYRAGIAALSFFILYFIKKIEAKSPSARQIHQQAY